MKTKARFYHAGYPVCVGAKQGLGFALGANKFGLKVVRLRGGS